MNENNAEDAAHAKQIKFMKDLIADYESDLKERLTKGPEPDPKKK